MLKNFWGEAVEKIFAMLLTGNKMFFEVERKAFFFSEEPYKESELSFFFDDKIGKRGNFLTWSSDLLLKAQLVQKHNTITILDGSTICSC